MPFGQRRVSAGRFATNLAISRGNTSRFASRQPSLGRVSEDELEEAAERGEDVYPTANDDLEEEEEYSDEKEDSRKATCKRLVTKWASTNRADRRIFRPALATYAILEPANPLIPAITVTECDTDIPDPMDRMARWAIPWNAPTSLVLTGQAEFIASSAAWRVGSSIFKQIPERRYNTSFNKRAASSSTAMRFPPPEEDPFADIDLDDVPYKHDPLPLRRTGGNTTRGGWPKYSLSASLSASLSRSSSRSSSRDSSSPVSSASSSSSGSLKAAGKSHEALAAWRSGPARVMGELGQVSPTSVGSPVCV